MECSGHYQQRNFAKKPPPPLGAPIPLLPSSIAFSLSGNGLNGAVTALLVPTPDIPCPSLPAPNASISNANP